MYSAVFFVGSFDRRKPKRNHGKTGLVLKFDAVLTAHIRVTLNWPVSSQMLHCNSSSKQTKRNTFETLRKIDEYVKISTCRIHCGETVPRKLKLRL